MSEIIVAVYENGVLRPVTPVSLSEGETVRLRIVPEVSPGGPKTELDLASCRRNPVSGPPRCLNNYFINPLSPLRKATQRIMFVNPPPPHERNPPLPCGRRT